MSLMKTKTAKRKNKDPYVRGLLTASIRVLLMSHFSTFVMGDKAAPATAATTSPTSGRLGASKQYRPA